MILFCDRGCPFAHRVHALVAHIGCAVDVREAMVGAKPAGLEQYTSSGRIPLLVHDELVLTESRVMMEHLSEYYEIADAYPADLRARSHHRHAMAVVDDFLAPRLFGLTDARMNRQRLVDVLTALERATETAPPRPSMLALHVAPIWLRFRWWQPKGVITRAVEARETLCSWLDAAVDLDCVTHTAPDRATQEDDLARARKAGLMPAETRRQA